MLLVACSPKLTEGSGDASEGKKAVYFGTISYTESYCGGARPPEELLQQLATPKPFASDTLRVKNVETGTEYLVVTDEHGHYEMELPAGNYVVHPKFRTTAAGYSPNYEANCKQWRELQLHTLNEVKAGEEKAIDFTVHFPCDPCETMRRP
jgi:hypothetical protein